MLSNLVLVISLVSLILFLFIPSEVNACSTVGQIECHWNEARGCQVTTCNNQVWAKYRTCTYEDGTICEGPHFFSNSSCTGSEVADPLCLLGEDRNCQPNECGGNGICTNHNFYTTIETCRTGQWWQPPENCAEDDENCKSLQRNGDWCAEVSCGRRCANPGTQTAECRTVYAQQNQNVVAENNNQLWQCDTESGSPNYCGPPPPTVPPTCPDGTTAPLNLRVVSENPGSQQIMWDRPSSNTPIVTYKFRLDDMTANGWINSANCSSVNPSDSCNNNYPSTTVNWGFTAGHTYHIWVQAVSDKCDGNVAEITVTIPNATPTPTVPPATPTPRPTGSVCNISCINPQGPRTCSDPTQRLYVDKDSTYGASCGTSCVSCPEGMIARSDDCGCVAPPAAVCPASCGPNNSGMCAGASGNNPSFNPSSCNPGCSGSWVYTSTGDGACGGLNPYCFVCAANSGGGPGGNTTCANGNGVCAGQGASGPAFGGAPPSCSGSWTYIGADTCPQGGAVPYCFVCVPPATPTPTRGPTSTPTPKPFLQTSGGSVHRQQ